MNTFVKNYLQNIIPVPFQIESDGDIDKIGNGTPEFTVKMRGNWTKALMTSTSLALGESLYERRYRCGPGPL